MDKVTVLAPAKLNLSLDIVGLLPGGYHGLDMVMQAVTLYEKVELEKSREIAIQCFLNGLHAETSRME